MVLTLLQRGKVREVYRAMISESSQVAENFSYQTDRYEIKDRVVSDRNNHALIGTLLDDNDLTRIISASKVSSSRVNEVIAIMFFKYKSKGEAK